MRVLMMLVVDVQVLVLERFVCVYMAVALEAEQEDASDHEYAGHIVDQPRSLAQQRYSDQRADERSCRKIGRLSSGAEQAERAHVEHQAASIARCAEEQRSTDDRKIRQLLT